MTKISELTSIVTGAATDIIAVVQGGVTKKATVQDYRDAGIIPTADQATALAAYQAALAAAEADQVLTATGPGEAAFADPAGGGAVDSVNGQTGAVVLDAADVGAAASSELSSYLPKTAGSGEAVTGTLYLDPGSDDAAQVLKIPVTDSDGADFNFNLAKVNFSGTDDLTFNWGFNNAAGSAESTAKHAWYLQLEYSYNEGGVLQCEYHLNHIPPGGGGAFRPMQFKTRADGTNSETSFKGDIFRIQGRGDETGILVTDIGAADQAIVTASNTTEIRVGETSGAFILKNSDSAINVLQLDNKDITSRARVWTFADADGNTLMQLSDVANSLSSNIAINVTGTLDQTLLFVRGPAGHSKYLLTLNNSADSRQFGIRYDGRILTNQAAANTATPSGATAYQLPIYNAAGTLLGYIPVYGSAWT